MGCSQKITGYINNILIFWLTFTLACETLYTNVLVSLTGMNLLLTEHQKGAYTTGLQLCSPWKQRRLKKERYLINKTIQYTHFR